MKEEKKAKELKKENSKIEKVEMPKKESKKEKTKSKKVVKKVVKKHKRSKKYQELTANFDKSKYYKLTDAVEMVKKLSYSKFDGSFEFHARLLKKKNEDSFRKMVELPHGSGKKLNIIVLDEKKIDEIVKTKKINFDIALATPEMMPKVAKIARILGPKGKMPNPKTGTVTANPEETIKELNAGKVEIKEEGNGLIHQVVGKVSWESKKIIENIQKILSQIPISKLKSITICATMSPGVKIRLK